MKKFAANVCLTSPNLPGQIENLVIYCHSCYFY